MDEATRDRRVAELRVLQFENPLALIERYCHLTGQLRTTQLPYGVSFSRMIDTIVDHEPDLGQFTANSSQSTTG